VIDLRLTVEAYLRENIDEDIIIKEWIYENKAFIFLRNGCIKTFFLGKYNM